MVVLRCNIVLLTAEEKTRSGYRVYSTRPLKQLICCSLLQAPSDGHNAKKKKVHRKKWVEEVKNEMLLSRLDCNDKDGAYESELQKDGDFLRLKLYKMFTKS